MDYRYLGRSALKVSPLCLGTMMFGGATDEPTAQRIIAHAHAQGVNFIDTADVYTGGAAERIVGRGIASQRDDWVLASKFGSPVDTAPNRQGQSRKWINQVVEASLKRLGTDYLDILYFHRAVPGVTLAEGVRAVGDLIRQGKVRYFAVSNLRGWYIAEVVRLADEMGLDRPVASQPLYNLVNRTVEVEQLPAAYHYGLGVVPYSPLARRTDRQVRPEGPPPPDSRAGRGDQRIRQTEWRRESLHIAQSVAAHAASRGISSAAFALAWVLNNRCVSSVIAGPRTEAQWHGYLKALQVRIEEQDECFVDSLVPPGHCSTPYYTDPSYPVEGRFRSADQCSLAFE
ncbi:aldo/keto reductase [Pseudomonas putida]